MKKTNTNLTKEELEIYVLLLCANADSIITEEELNFIQTKVDQASFDKIYEEFLQHTEDEGLDIIEDSHHEQDYGTLEIAEMKDRIRSLFFVDSNFSRKEKHLERVLNNIIY